MGSGGPSLNAKTHSLPRISSGLFLCCPSGANALARRADFSGGDGVVGFDDDGFGCFLQRFLLSADFVEDVLEVDEREKRGEEPVEAKSDGLATVVVVEKLFAHFEDDDDPEEQRIDESEACDGRNRPIERTGAGLDFADPEAKVSGPDGGDGEERDVAILIGDEPEDESFSGDEQDKENGPVEPGRRRIGGAVVHSITIGGLMHTVSYLEIAIPRIM